MAASIVYVGSMTSDDKHHTRASSDGDSKAPEKPKQEHPNKNTQTRTPKQEHPNNVRTLSRQFSKEKAAFVCARNDYLEQHVLQQHDST